jgi:exodeoxyribonuclease VII small subunit
MTDETYTFEQTRVRLEGILVEVRKKDTSLEQSLELLEEGVRLLNQCNELIDQTAWRPPVGAPEDADPTAGAVPEPSPGEAAAGADTEADAADPLGEAPAAEDVGEPGGEADEAEALPDDERD